MFDYKCNGAVGGLVRLGRNQTHFFGRFSRHRLNAISFAHESSQSGQETSLIALSLKGLLLHVDETLGGEITQIEFGGIELLAYQEWIKPNNARENNALSQARKDWLTNYRGGWQFLVPNAGSECEVDGVFHPFHGEWSRTHVSIVEHSDVLLRMRATVQTSIVVERVISLESDPERIKLTTTLKNESDEPTSFIWGEHPAFIALPGDRIDMPTAPVANSDGVSVGNWPASSNANSLDVVSAEAPYESVHYVTNVSSGWAALRRSEVGIALAWDTRDFPHVWLWRENGSPGFPFFGQASLIAIEPASTWPGMGLNEARKRGQAFTLLPSETRSTVVTMVPFSETKFPVCNVTVDGQIDFAS